MKLKPETFSRKVKGWYVRIAGPGYLAYVDWRWYQDGSVEPTPGTREWKAK